MIQNGTYLNIIDNSGAKEVICIKVLSGYRRRYAFIGDLITVSVKSLRLKRRAFSKTKKGEVHRALVVRTKILAKNLNSDKFGFFENSAILLNKQNTCLGTRIFGAIPKSFRYTKFLKIASISSGLIS
jgi:large subunit ribosomal protein L14